MVKELLIKDLSILQQLAFLLFVWEGEKEVNGTHHDEVGYDVASSFIIRAAFEYIFFSCSSLKSSLAFVFLPGNQFTPNKF